MFKASLGNSVRLTRLLAFLLPFFFLCCLSLFFVSGWYWGLNPLLGILINEDCRFQTSLSKCARRCCEMKRAARPVAQDCTPTTLGG